MIELRKEKRYITSEDIAIINEALNNGYDIAIKRTVDGAKIIREQAAVLRRTNLESRSK